MSDRNNYGTGQVVTEGELDGSFTYAENAEHDMAIDTGAAQVDVGSSPDADVYGGILTGLVVSGTGSDTVSVSAGAAKDNQGRRISCGAATVKVTGLGATVAGVVADAVATTAATTGSCPIGDYIIMSLYIVYDELQSDERTDGASVTYHFVEAESFHFELAVGASWTGAPGSAPDRAGMADGKVLLADLRLTNNAGTMRVETILVSTADWNALGGNYALNDGRRSDWLALDDTTNHPLLVTEGHEVRGGNARAIINQLMQLLQSTTNGKGDDLLAAIAKTGNVTTAYAAQTAARALTAGTVNSQLKELLDLFRYALFLGGDNTLKPAATYNGLILDPTNVSYDRAIQILKNVGTAAGSKDQRITGMKYGHIARAHEFFDDFMVLGNGTYVLGDDTDSKWGVLVTNGGTATIIQAPGGVVRLTTDTNLNDIVRITTGDNQSGGTAFPWWSLGGAPYCIFMCRFRIPSSLVNKAFRIGLFDSGNLPIAGGAAGSGLYFEFDQTGATTPDVGANSNLYFTARNTGGTVDQNLLGAIAPDTWYTVRAISSVSSGGYGQACADGNIGDFVAAEVAGTTAADACFSAILEAQAGAALTLDVDQVFVSDAYLSPDMTF